MQTAVVESSGAANPHVPVLKLWVVSLSPTFAGRNLTLCRLKSHMAEELLSCERPTNPDPLAKNGLTVQRIGSAYDALALIPIDRAAFPTQPRDLNPSGAPHVNAFPW